MNDIPEDTMKAAYACLAGFTKTQQLANVARAPMAEREPLANVVRALMAERERCAIIARALMAERERCAIIADNYDPPLPDDVYVGEVMRGQTEVAHSISTAIRKGAR